MALLPVISDLGSHNLPMIYGDAFALNVDPATRTPAPLTDQQYHAIGYALLSSLAV